MERDARLLRLSREHHHGLVMALRIERELPGSTDAQMRSLYGDLVRFWSAGLLPHFTAENDCLLARLAQHADPGLAHAGRLQREHREMEDLVEEMRSAATSDDRRVALERFGVRLREHIRWEERDLFDWMQASLTPEEMDGVGAYLEAHLPAVPMPAPTAHDV
jgi:hemerythrin-like domain-containing protein